MNVSLLSMLKLLKRIVETNNTGVTGRVLPPNTDFEHGPRNSAYVFGPRQTHTLYTKYSTLPRGISVYYIEPKVGIFSEAEGRGKYSLPRVQYMPIFHKEGF